MLWLGQGALNADIADESEGIPVLRRAEAQAEAGPLMLMVRRANMRLSIAAGGRIAKPRRGYDRHPCMGVDLSRGSLRAARRLGERGGGMPMHRPAPIDHQKSGGVGLWIGRG